MFFVCLKNDHYFSVSTLILCTETPIYGFLNPVLHKDHRKILALVFKEDNYDILQVLIKKLTISFCLFLSCFTALNGGKAKRWSSGKDILNSWYASSDIRPLSFATSTLLVLSHDVGSSSSLLSSSDRGMITSWPWTSNLIWNKANRFYTSATCLAGSFGRGYFLTKI